MLKRKGEFSYEGGADDATILGVHLPVKVAQFINYTIIQKTNFIFGKTLTYSNRRLI